MFTGPEGTNFTVPVVSEPSLAADTVPIQDPAPSWARATAGRRDVTTVVPGGPLAVDDVTTHYFEFDVSAEHDNAWLEGTATPAQDADLDIWLDRQQADGSWSRSRRVRTTAT